MLWSMVYHIALAKADQTEARSQRDSDRQFSQEGTEAKTKRINKIHYINFQFWQNFSISLFSKYYQKVYSCVCFI